MEITLSLEEISVIRMSLETRKKHLQTLLEHEWLYKTTKLSLSDELVVVEWLLKTL